MNRAARRKQAKATEQQQKQQQIAGTLENTLRQAAEIYKKRDYDQASALCAQVLKVNPDQIDALNLFGLCKRAMNELGSAEAAFKKAITIDPTYARGHYNLANLFKLKLQNEDAVFHFNEAVKHNPDHLDAWNNLGTTLQGLGEWEAAYHIARKLVNREPESQKNWINLRASQANYQALPTTSEPLTYDQELAKALPAQLDAHPNITNYINCLIADQLRLHPSIGKIISKTVESGKLPDDLKTTLETFQDPLFLRLASREILVDFTIERTLWEIRKQILLQTTNDNHQLPLDSIETLFTLSIQCFLNEYIYPVTDDEQRQLESLKEELESQNLAYEPISAWKLAAYGCYEPLHTLKNAQHYANWKDASNTQLQNIIHTQITEPLEEREIATTIEQFGTIEDGTSKAVREQYESNPYPRWVEAGEHKPVKIEHILHHLCPASYERELHIDANPNVLIAGCGTGQHAILSSRRYLDAQLTAIDLSRTSLAYAIRKARQYKIDNIDFMQADILELGKMDQQFDVVESAGTLHHMKDPMAGWKALKERLKPGGVMKIGLYSEIARQYVVQAREIISQQGLSSKPNDIRNFRKHMMESGEPKDLLHRLQFVQDFCSLSSCRDLLFHVQEHRFTLPEISDCVSELGLDFLGFEFINKNVIRFYQEENPDDTNANSLEGWHKYEQNNPNTFSGMYQFWLYKPI